MCPVIESIFHLLHRFQEWPQIRVSCFLVSRSHPGSHSNVPRTTKTALAFRLPSSAELFLKLSKSGNCPDGCPIFGITESDIPGVFEFKED